MATKYSNNLEVQLNQPLDTKYVCENLSDLTNYLYVGLITFCKADKTYYSLKEFKDGSPVWEHLNSNYEKGIRLSTVSPGGNYIDINHLVLGSEFYISSQTDFEGLGQYAAEISLNLGTALSVGDDGKLEIDTTELANHFSLPINIKDVEDTYTLGTLFIGSGLKLNTAPNNTHAIFIKIGEGLKFDSDNALCLSDSNSGSGGSGGGIGISTAIDGTPLNVSTLILGSNEAFQVDGLSGRLSLVLSSNLQIYNQELDLSTDVKELIGGGNVDLSEYAKKSDVPTKTSQLTNDSGYVTSEDVATAINSAIVSTLNTEV